MSKHLTKAPRPGKTSQSWLTGKVDSESLMEHLQYMCQRSSANWTKVFMPVWKDDKVDPEHEGDRCVEIECCKCFKRFAATNPSSTHTTHKCKAVQHSQTDDDQEAAGEAAGAVTPATPSGCKPSQRLITDNTCTPLQVKQASQYLLKYVCTSNTSFRQLNNPYLVKAFAVFGCTIPNEKSFRTVLLKEAYNEAKQQIMSRVLDQVKVGVHNHTGRCHDLSSLSLGHLCFVQSTIRCLQSCLYYNN